MCEPYCMETVTRHFFQLTWFDHSTRGGGSLKMLLQISYLLQAGVGRRAVIKRLKLNLWELFILRYFLFPEFRDKHNFCPLSLYLQIKCFILFRVPPKNQFCKCIVIIIHNIIILFTTLFIAEIHFLFTLLILKAFKTICNKYLGYIFGLKGWKGKDGYDKCLYKETRRGGVWGLNYFFVQ